MIYKYWVLSIQIINSDYIDQDRSEVELDIATHWTDEPSLARFPDEVEGWPCGGCSGESRAGGCKIILEKKFIQ